jgi:hypothetical protein
VPAPLQADQVPSKARTIAESATTSILLQQNVAQQHELMEKDRIIGELKCGLMITCNALKETNYMEEEVRQHSGRLVYFLRLIVTWHDARRSLLSKE